VAFTIYIIHEGTHTQTPAPWMQNHNKLEVKPSCLIRIQKVAKSAIHYTFRIQSTVLLTYLCFWIYRQKLADALQEMGKTWDAHSIIIYRRLHFWFMIMASLLRDSKYWNKIMNSYLILFYLHVVSKYIDEWRVEGGNQWESHITNNF